MLFVCCNPEIANFKHTEVNEPGRLYFDVTCWFILYERLAMLWMRDWQRYVIFNI